MGVAGAEPEPAPSLQLLSCLPKAPRLSSRRDGDPARYRRLYSVDTKGKRLSIVPANYSKDGLVKSGKTLATPPTPFRSHALTGSTMCLRGRKSG